MGSTQKRFFLVFFIRGLPDRVPFEVAEEVSDDLSRQMEGLCSAEGSTKVYQFDTVEGRSIAVNFEFVQAVRFLWDPAVNLPDQDVYDGGISMWCRGASDPIETSYEDPVSVYDFYTNIGYGPRTVMCPAYLDEDGELIVLNARELLYLVVPTTALNEGEAIVLAKAAVEVARKAPTVQVVKAIKTRASKKLY